MSVLDRQTAKVLLTILVFALALAIVYVARTVFVVFVFSILFAYLIDPVVRFLQRHSLFFKNLRGPHILEAYLALLILIAVAIHGLDPGFFRHAAGVIRGLPALSEEISTGEIATKIGDKYGWTDAQELRLKSFLIQHHERIRGVLENGQRIVPTATFFPQRRPNSCRFLHPTCLDERQRGGPAVLRWRPKRDGSALHKGQSNSGGPVAPVLFNDDMDFGLPPCIGAWCHGGSAGVYTRGWLDDLRQYHHHDWSAHSFSLDLDGGIAGAMANADGLFYFAACRGP
jgi:hypothetical protein